MESILGENGQANRLDPNLLRTDAGNPARPWRSVAGKEVADLMADVQDLLGRVAHVADPEIARARGKVEAAMTAAKCAITDGSNHARRQAKQAIKAGDNYVRGQPWQAVGIAATAGLLAGILVARR